MAALRFELRPFTELDSPRLYEILRVRAEVFIVEQRCQYLDPDGKDLSSEHVLGYRGDRLVCYLRIVPPGLSFPERAIGRVLTVADERGSGVGRALMMHALAHIEQIHGPSPVSLAAQAQLVPWYETLGFVATSESYQDAGIPHVDMIRPVARV